MEYRWQRSFYFRSLHLWITVKSQNYTRVGKGTLYPSWEATDFYHHFKEDIALAKEMGFRVFRMSINWSRIYPTGLETVPNEEGLKFYDNVFLRKLNNAGIEPLVTIFIMRFHTHWSKNITAGIPEKSLTAISDIVKQYLHDIIGTKLNIDLQWK